MGKQNQIKISDISGKPRLMEAPTMVKGVDELIAKKDTEYPDDPVCNIGDGTQDPVLTRIGHSGGVGIRELCHSGRPPK